MNRDQRQVDRRVSRVEGIDALRGLAALAVFCCHLVAYWGLGDLPLKLGQLSQVGAHGVDVFVVLSGFCLALPLVGEGRRLNLSAFFGRRAWRILPAYWVALIGAIVLATVPATWPKVVAARASIWDVVVHVFGLQTVFTPTIGTINGSLWSISLEITLYLTFPAAVLAWKRHGPIALVVATALVCVAWFALGAWVELDGPLRDFAGNEHSLPARLVQFCTGILTADMMYRRPPVDVRRTLGLAMLVSLAAALASTGELPRYVILPLWGWAGAALVQLFATLPRGAVLRRMDAWGRRSFSFYLLHQPLLLLMAEPVRGLPGGWIGAMFLGGPVALGFVTLVAELLHQWVEVPSHRRGRASFPNQVRRGDDLRV